MHPHLDKQQKAGSQSTPNLIIFSDNTKMVISYLGYASFKIKGSKSTVLFNPFDKRAVGPAFRKTEADIVLISKEGRAFSYLENIKGNPYVISGPGEYEVNNVMALGFPSYDKVGDDMKLSDNTVYRLEIEGVHIAHLGALTSKLSEKEYDQLGKLDIVFVPVGEGSMINTRVAAEVVNKLEPSIVIPMCYYDADCVGEYKDLAKVDKFLEAMGSSVPEPISSLRVSSSQFSDTEEGAQVILLERK